MKKTSPEKYGQAKQLIFTYIIIFLIYTYLGATLEHLSYYFSKQKKQLANPIITGFPVYGIGALLIIFINEFIKDYALIYKFLIFALIITLLEFIVGIYVSAGPKSYTGDLIASWDYSKEPYNIMGIISLRHFISWGILSLIIVTITPFMIKRISCS